MIFQTPCTGLGGCRRARGVGCWEVKRETQGRNFRTQSTLLQSGSHILNFQASGSIFIKLETTVSICMHITARNTVKRFSKTCTKPMIMSNGYFTIQKLCLILISIMYTYIQRKADGLGLVQLVPLINNRIILLFLLFDLCITNWALW